MSRIVRSHEPPQPVLPLGHGPIQWSTLSDPVRERVLALWMELLTEHLAHAAADAPPELPPRPAIGSRHAPMTEERT